LLEIAHGYTINASHLLYNISVNNKTREERITLTNKRYLLYTFLFLVICAIATAFIMEWRARAGDAGEALNFAIQNIRPFVVEAAVLFLLMTLLSSAIGDALIGSAIVFAAFVIMTFVHVNKMAARNEPFLPMDFAFILNFGDMTAMTKPMDNAKQIILIGVVLIICLAASILLRRCGVKQLSFRKLPRARIIASAVALFLLFTLTFSFIFPQDIRKFESSVMGLDFNDWDQSANYKENGFIIGFMYNMAIVRMDKPEGYSKDAILSIVEKYKRHAAYGNAERTDPANSDINIVYIMNESFCDPNSFSELFPYNGGNAVAFTERVMSEYPSGNVISPAFGGGTAFVEFESLTGFSNWFRGVTLPYHYYVKKKNSFPSIASYLKNKGYYTIALHPYSGLMYDRRPAFASMGFDKFLDKKDFTYTDKDRTAQYISDVSAYKELIKTLRDTDGKAFAMLITMQNHTPYGNQYIPGERQFMSEAAVDEDTNAAVSDYLELLSASDKAMNYLVSELEKFDEKTVVVFWGDHLPGVYITLPDDDVRKWETPFFIYANFDLDAEGANPGDFSPNYISPEFFRTAGLKAPAFYYLLDEVKKENPALVRRWKHTHDETGEALKDYELIQYDVMSGEGYSLSTDFFGSDTYR
jgi:phosphoglycerol transferase MdoB-like AlkP superfamily enzyme